MQHENILDAIEEMIETSGKPRKAIAEEMGKPYTTLMRELNPADDGAKFGVLDLVRMLSVCGGIQPLQHLAARCGCRVVCIDAQPDGRDMQDELVQALDAVSEYMQAVNAGEGYVGIGPKLERAIKELEDIFARVRGVCELPTRRDAA